MDSLQPERKREGEGQGEGQGQGQVLQEGEGQKEKEQAQAQFFVRLGPSACYGSWLPVIEESLRCGATESIPFLFQRLSQQCTNQFDTLFLLSCFARFPLSSVGVHNTNLESVSRHPASGRGPSGNRTDSLPISPLDAKEWFAAKAVDLDFSSATLITYIALGIVAAFNFLYGVGWTSNPILPDFFSPLSEAQAHILDHIYTASKFF